MKWRKARKKPVVVEFREPIPNFKHRDGVESEEIQTPEGPLYAVPGKHYVIRGVKGELYPIKKEVFEETYEVIDEFKFDPKMKIEEIPPKTVWEICIKMGISMQGPAGAVTLSPRFLRLVIRLYEGMFQRTSMSKRKKIASAIMTAINLLAERKGIDKRTGFVCGLLGFLSMLSDEAEANGEKAAARAAKVLLKGPSARFNADAVVRHLKRMIRAREEALLDVMEMISCEY